MRIWYFVHATGRDPGNAGIQRVMRGLGRALLAQPGVELVPVRWSEEKAAIVQAEPVFLDTVAAHSGPLFAPPSAPGEPVREQNGEPKWLLIPELPRPGRSDPGDPPLAIAGPLACARRLGLRSAVIVYDLLPPAHPIANERGDAERLDLTNYAPGLIDADLVLPVSDAAGTRLAGWFADAGYRAELWPRFAPVELPHEIVGWPRRIPEPQPAAPSAQTIEFTTFGTVCARTNQLALLEAFNRLVLRRPELPLALHVVGHCEPELASRFARQIRRSGGHAQAHGHLADDKLVPLIAGSRATVFLSPDESLGLPVAGSLWLGVPCLCSNIPPIAEIAAPGGCLTVDPSDLEAISAGLERLAEDAALHRRLLGELAMRRLRTWQDYAATVLAELGYDGGERRVPAPPARRQAQAPGTPIGEVSMSSAAVALCEHWFTIAASELSCHDAYMVPGGNALRSDGAIAFDAIRNAGVAERVLFFGPYLTVEPGVYLFDFEGEVDGHLILRFTHNGGKLIREVSVDSFAGPVCLPLIGRFESFEVVGVKTPALKSLRLASIGVHHIDPTGKSG
jgi:glycosyltransferase involved in cell wall biosynthesis